VGIPWQCRRALWHFLVLCDPLWGSNRHVAATTVLILRLIGGTYQKVYWNEPYYKWWILLNCFSPSPMTHIACVALNSLDHALYQAAGDNQIYWPRQITTINAGYYVLGSSVPPGTRSKDPSLELTNFRKYCSIKHSWVGPRITCSCGRKWQTGRVGLIMPFRYGSARQERATLKQNGWTSWIQIKYTLNRYRTWIINNECFVIPN
jgi:hypothetical protein